MTAAASPPYRDEDISESDGEDDEHEETTQGRSSVTFENLPEIVEKRHRLIVFLALGALLVALMLSIPMLFLNRKGTRQRLPAFLPGFPGESEDEKDGSLYYDWETGSAFDPVRLEVSAPDLGMQDLCAAFPKHLLNDAQPVLKTGHGVLESRVPPQLQSSLSCLDNLLIFSDVSESFDGRELIDVIADTPEDLLDSTDQLEPYRRLRDCVNDKEDESCDDVITPKEGWKIDKFKFLPAVIRAWQMRRERKWYVFFEADTYVEWDTVFRLLDHFDADEVYYFGSPSPGKNDTWFGYGGAGFILSRRAMRRLVEDDGEHLIKAEWEELLNDCCGDSRSKAETDVCSFNIMH